MSEIRAKVKEELVDEHTEHAQRMSQKLIDEFTVKQKLVTHNHSGGELDSSLPAFEAMVLRESK